MKFSKRVLSEDYLASRIERLTECQDLTIVEYIKKSVRDYFNVTMYDLMKLNNRNKNRDINVEHLNCNFNIYDDCIELFIEAHIESETSVSTYNQWVKWLDRNAVGLLKELGKSYISFVGGYYGKKDNRSYSTWHDNEELNC